MNTTPSHLEQIADLLAASPPRKVPAALQRSAMRQGASLLLIIAGGFGTVCSLVFCFAFFPWEIARQWKLDAADSATRPGKIVAVDRTNLSINHTPVIRFTFEYLPSVSGRVVRGTCYTTGRRWNEGADVTVRYRPNDPTLACVEGARLTETSGGAVFVVLLPGVGLASVIIGLTLRKRTLHLLVHGHVTEAIVIKLERTSTRINNHLVLKIVLKRIDRPDDPPFEVRKYQPDVVAFARARLESEQPVFVLFDPQYPRRALLPETL